MFDIDLLVLIEVTFVKSLKNETLYLFDRKLIFFGNIYNLWECESSQYIYPMFEK